MVDRARMTASTLAAGIATLAWATASFAQTAPASAPATAPAPAPAPATATATATSPESIAAAPADTYSGPSRAVIGTGLLALGLSYAAAAVVASSSHLAADQNDLYYPVIGPWMDIGDRPACGAGSTPCRSETWNILALSLDGLAQAWGVVATVTGLLVWEHPSTSVARVQITPARIGAGGYGLATAASF